MHLNITSHPFILKTVQKSHQHLRLERITLFNLVTFVTLKAAFHCVITFSAITPKTAPAKLISETFSSFLYKELQWTEHYAGRLAFLYVAYIHMHRVQLFTAS